MCSNSGTTAAASTAKSGATKDVAKGEALTWLESIDKLPALRESNRFRYGALKAEQGARCFRAPLVLRANAWDA